MTAASADGSPGATPGDRAAPTPAIDPNRALTFGRVADEYARWRPGYPAEAVEWLVRDASHVAEVGAGTGKLTAALLDRGLTVEAVEPDGEMLAVLRRLCPGAVPHQASADRLPLADAAVDAVLVADAWHWFPHERAVAEVRRVLRPGGWLGLVWNVPKPAERWELELAGVDPDRKGLEPDPEPGLPFPPAETSTAAFPWAWEVSPDHWRAYLATHSGVIALDGAERERRLDSSRAIVAGECARSGRATAPLRHEAFCIRWQPGRVSPVWPPVLALVTARRRECGRMAAWPF